MICLTGDLHHTSLGTGNQKHCDTTELKVAQIYLNLLRDANVKVTFFVSGKCFLEEWQDLQPICESPLVEIGGHNYSCFQPEIIHRISKKLCGSFNGPAWMQRWDTRKTMEIIKNKTGKTIQCWRNHMYMHGPNTEPVLAECGIKICSDGVKKDSNGPEWRPSGLLNFPLNIIPDHEHLYHAERTPEWVEWWIQRYNWSDDFGSKSYYIEEWTELVLDGLQKNEENNILSNMIIHPITLYLCDKLRSFQKILEFLSNKETVHMSGIVQAEEQKKHGKQ